MPQLSRREFLGTAALGAGAFLVACRKDGPTAPTQEIVDNATIEISLPAGSTGGTGAVVGWQPLGIASARDGMLYVPEGYDPAVPAPLLVLLHPAGVDSAFWDSAELRFNYDINNLVILAPDSRFNTWDLVVQAAYHEDVDFLHTAIQQVFDTCNIDTTRIGIGGFSDGASESLGIGLINAHIFSRVVAFTPGLLSVPFRRGEPDVFYTAGISDEIIPIQQAQDFIVPLLLRNGCEVDYHEFEGGHEIPTMLRNEAIQWAAASRLE